MSARTPLAYYGGKQMFAAQLREVTLAKRAVRKGRES
jgi:hypothetical protein